MNKTKRKLKGFTLIELIIVLAIFSVIMTLVMSFIDPVSRLMTKTSTRERTAAYVDNIDEYISKSIRHAQTINVYTNGLYCEDTDIVYNPYASDSEKFDFQSNLEARVVRNFVDNYYDGAIFFDGTNLKPLTGRVHVLKLINQKTVDISDATKVLEPGHIYESVYTFTSGLGDNHGRVYLDRTTYEKIPDTALVGKTKEELAQLYYPINAISYHESETDYYSETNPDLFHHASVSILDNNIPVINTENFKEYSYYFKIGMNTFEPIKSKSDYNFDESKNPEAKTAMDGEGVDFDAIMDSDKFFYSRLNPTVNSPAINESSFVLSIVAFMNDKGYSKIVCENTSEADDVVLFKSPSAMSSLGLTFKNAVMRGDSRSLKYYRKSIKSPLDTEGVLELKDGKPTLEAIEDTMPPFNVISDTFTNEDNIYFVYAVPDEINDTKWDLNGKSKTGGAAVTGESGC